MELAAEGGCFGMMGLKHTEAASVGSHVIYYISECLATVLLNTGDPHTYSVTLSVEQPSGL